MQQDTQNALRPPRPLRASPAFPDAPRVVSAVRVAFPGSRVHGAEVEVSAGGYRFRLLVRAGRVLWPLLRGEDAVTVEDAAHRARIESAASTAAARVLA